MQYELGAMEGCIAAGKTFWFKGTSSLFLRDGMTQKVNPYNQGSLAKELDIVVLDGKKLF